VRQRFVATGRGKRTRRAPVGIKLVFGKLDGRPYLLADYHQAETTSPTGWRASTSLAASRSRVIADLDCEVAKELPERTPVQRTEENERKRDSRVESNSLEQTPQHGEPSGKEFSRQHTTE
jgi:hypothetical protein